jgi:signal transduction histidine kinase
MSKPMWRRIGQKYSPRAWLGVALGIFCVAAVSWAVLSEAQRAAAERERTAYWELHAVQVQLQTQLLLGAVVEAESGQRGYVMTGDERYLESYRDALAVLPGHMAALQTLTEDNPAQQSRLVEVERLLQSRLERLAQVLDTAARGNRTSAAAMVREGVGLNLMRDLRDELDLVWRAEADIRAQRAAESEKAAAEQRRSTWMVIALAGVLLTALLALSVSAMRAAEAARTEAARAEIARRVQAELETRVAQAIEQQRKTEAALRQSQKMEAVGQLAGGIAHDFNNMLAVIIGSLELAQRRISAGQIDIDRYISNAIDGARRAAALTQRILAFSRRQPLEPKVVNLNRMVSDMSELLHRTLGEQIKLETVLASGLWPAFVDAHQLENVIVNLAVNARDAMPEGGALTIETGNAYLDDAYVSEHEGMTPGQYAFLAVTDTGVGMPPDVVAQAFEPFFTTKGLGKGTGLGLSQAFGFVKQSGGHIKIYSEIGQGTSIKVYLPRRHGEAGAEAPAARAAVAPRGAAEELILVVEDDERVRLVSVEALRELGYSVQHASNGVDALTLLDANPNIALLFTDIVMPDMGGRQLAEEATRRKPGLKVLYTTGYTKNSIVHNGVLDADVAFIAKPFAIEQLARKVRSVLDE